MFQLVWLAAFVFVVILEFWFRFLNHSNDKLNRSKTSKGLNVSSYLFESCSKMEAHPTYTNHGIANQSFFDEMQASVGKISSLPLEARNVIGDYINIDGGERLTKNSSPNNIENDSVILSNENWIALGGSTVLCLEVPDAFTWPSYLQATIDSSPKNGVRIHNFGQPGLKSAKINQLFPLFLNRYTEVTQIVVYFGVNDAGWIAGSRPTSRLVYVIDFVLDGLSAVSKLFAFLTLRMRAQRVSRASADYANRTIKKFFDYHDYFNSKGIKIYFILQPNVFCKTRPSRLEIDLIESAEPLRITGLHAAYETYLSNGGGLIKPAVSTFSDTDETIFIDWCHVGVKGNSLIARRIWDILNDVPNSQVEINTAMSVMKSHKDTALKARRIFQNKDEMVYNYPLF